jgi:AraC-like DNA-binding protein
LRKRTNTNQGVPLPLASVRHYSNSEQFEAAYLAADVQITPVGRQAFAARVARLELDDLWIVQVNEAAPRIKWATQSAERVVFRFLAEPAAEFVINGVPLQYNEVVQLGRADSYYEHTTGPISWGGMSLPVVVAAETSIALNGFDVFQRREPAREIPEPGAMARLRLMHSEVAALANVAPNLVREPEVVRSIEQSLAVALFNCLREPDVRQSSWVQRSHSTVMRRLRDLLEINSDSALYVPEICSAIGVSERTLRVCCHEYLGMGPMHYLSLRRMHLARRALSNAEPGTTTVTEIATRFGFWHFGRFAGSYRSIFGESPSATLLSDPR